MCGALLLALTASTAAAEQEGSLEQLLTIPVPDARPYEVIKAEPVVGASRYEQRQGEIAASAVVITRDEIRSFGWRTVDDALASLPGVYKTYDRLYSYLGVRGFGMPGDYSTRILMMIDGVRLNEPLYDSAPFGRSFPLDMDLVERIEFIPGPGGAVYGQNAMFGVVNVVTRKGAAIDGGEFGLAWRPPQSSREARLSWGKRLENDVDLMISASALRSDGEDLALAFNTAGGGIERGIARGLDGERDNEFALKASRGPWAFGLTHGDRRKDDPVATYGTDFFAPGSYEREQYTVAHLDYRDQLSPTLSMTARAIAGSYRFESTLLFDGLPYNYPAASDWQGLELQLMSTAIAAHTLMLGVDYQRNQRIDQNRLDPADPTFDWHDRRDGYRFGVYMQDTWQLGETLEATLGLRVDRNDRNDRTGTTFSPRLGLSWNASPQTALKLLYGRAHRAPNAYQSYYAEEGYLQPNPELGGEVVDTVEFVLDHRVNRDLHLRASLYQWEINDFIDLTDMDGAARYQSAGKVTSRGLELSAEQAWHSGTRLRGSLSLQDATYCDGARVENSPRVLGRLNLSAPIPSVRMRTGIELAYDGARRSSSGNRVAAHWLANVHLLAERWVPGVDLSLSVLNLFDEDYAHPSAGGETHPLDSLRQDGRSVWLKVGYRF